MKLDVRFNFILHQLYDMIWLKYNFEIPSFARMKYNINDMNTLTDLLLYVVSLVSYNSRCHTHKSLESNLVQWPAAAISTCVCLCASQDHILYKTLYHIIRGVFRDTFRVSLPSPFPWPAGIFDANSLLAALMMSWGNLNICSGSQQQLDCSIAPSVCYFEYLISVPTHTSLSLSVSFAQINLVRLSIFKPQLSSDKLWIMNTSIKIIQNFSALSAWRILPGLRGSGRGWSGGN